MVVLENHSSKEMDEATLSARYIGCGLPYGRDDGIVTKGPLQEAIARLNNL